MRRLKNIPTDLLLVRRHEIECHRRCLSTVYEETDRLSVPAQADLAIVRRALRIEVEAIDAELAIRETMMPTEPVESDIDVFDLARVA